MQIANSIIGCFILDDEKIKEKKLYNDYKQFIENRENYIKQFTKKYPDIKEDILPNKREFYQKLYEINKEITKLSLQKSVSYDNLINQSYNSIKEIEKTKNIIMRRMEEWYSLFLPEIFHMDDKEKIINLIITKSKSQIMHEIKIKESIGSDPKESDLEYIRHLAKEIQSLSKLQEKQKEYLESIMSDYCPNLFEVAGTIISAGLIEHTGSLRKLAIMSSSTIQILGAEKALFRHLQRNTNPPKYGIIINHPLISKSPINEKAKRARKLAAAISKAAKIDFFKGDSYQGYSLKKKLEEEYNAKSHR